MHSLLPRLALLALLGSLLSACATAPGGKGAAKGAAPEDRAVARWNLLIARKAELAYDYLSPGKRATETREAYASAMNSRPIRWEKVTLHSKTCDKEDACRIALQVDVTVPSGGAGGMTPSLGFVEETWIRAKDGVWYLLPPGGAKAGP